MQQISFGSTYRIPFPTNKPGKVRALKNFLEKFPIHTYTTSDKKGTARVSVPKNQDQMIESYLQRNKFKNCQKFPERHGDLSLVYTENPGDRLDYYICSALKNPNNYTIVGKKEKKKP